MMREIKFRLWIHDWGGGRMEYDGFGVNESGKVLFLDEEVYTVGHRANQDRIVMQYTGLKDKNGNEIYEGDIVKIPNNGVSEIKWSYGEWNVEDFAHSAGSNNIYNFLESDIEIIGNIYQNPELLK